MKTKHFITFEGPEGSGKSTIINMIYNKLSEEGLDILLSREPGGSRISEEIRDIVLSPNNIDLCPSAEALLYAASRAQHFEEKIIPALNDNRLVLCDRFLDSSLVYQGVGRKLGVEEVYEINRFAIKDMLPTLTIFFDIEPSLGLERINKNKERKYDRLDMEKLSFHEVVYQGYLDIAKKYPDRIKTVNARNSIEQVFEDTLKLIMEVCYE